MRFQRTPLLAFLLLVLPSVSESAPDNFRLASPDFAPGAFIPARFTGDGENVPPALRISGVPAAAKSLVLIVDDPDAPSGTFTHWLVWNIPPAATSLTHPASFIQGANGFGTPGYSGPKPPSGTHRYFFRLSALDTTLALPPGASRRDLDAAIQGHIIATAVLMGRYTSTATQ